MLGQLLDLPHRHADVVQPLHTDFLTGALPHGLLHEVAGFVGEQTVNPHQALILGLIPELGLTVDGPAQEPAGILHGHDAAGNHAAGKGVTLADILDIGNDLLIQCGDGGAHPVGLLRIMAELVGMTEGRILCSNSAPHIPATAGLDFGVEGCHGVLGTHGGVLHAATVGNEHQIVFRQVNKLMFALRQQLNTLCLLFTGLDVELHIDHLGVIVELDTEAFQILDHGQNHRFVLVITGEPQSLEVRQTAHMVDIALEIQLHFQSAVPVLKGKHGAPVEPEIGVQHLIIEEIRDALIVQIFIGGEEQLHDLHCSLVGQTELAVGVGILTLVDGCPAEGVVGVFLIQPVVFVQNTDPFRLDGRNGAEQIPHDLEMVIHLPSAPHDIAYIGVLPAIACTAGNGVFLIDVDVLTLQLSVTNQIAGGSQSRKAGADDVGRFVVHALGLSGTGKGFVITAGIIHNFSSLLYWHPLFERCFFVYALIISGRFFLSYGQRYPLCLKFRPRG